MKNHLTYPPEIVQQWSHKSLPKSPTFYQTKSRILNILQQILDFVSIQYCSEDFAMFCCLKIKRVTQHCFLACPNRSGGFRKLREAWRIMSSYTIAPRRRIHTYTLYIHILKHMWTQYTHVYSPRLKLITVCVLRLLHLVCAIYRVV